MMKNIVIKKSIENDEIQKLFRKMFDVFQEDQNIEYPYTESGINYLKQRIDNGISFVAKIDEKTVGFLTGSIQKAIDFKTYDKYGFIENVYVEEEYRKNADSRIY